LRAVCSRAGVAPERVQYIEAHGTGTAVGDPAECAAMSRALAGDRPAGNYLHIGSVKTNIGHLEPASGVAGLIKLALSLQHGTVPASLHFQTPNPQIDFEALHLQVQQAAGPWPAGHSGAVGGVNSFGFGGANAHALLQEYQPSPPATRLAAGPNRCHLLPMSARCTEALEDLAKAYLAQLLEAPELSIHDLCFSASLRRDHHEHRLALAARSAQELGDRLCSFVAGERGRGIAAGRVAGDRKPRLAFVFSGNGPQWWGMGRRLLEEEPVFRQAVEACDSLLRQYSPWSVLKELQQDEADSGLGRTEVAQPALFAIQIGLVELWQSWGVRPDAVVGHSVGEVAAACAAGALSLEDAVRVIFHRSRTQGTTAGTGRMAAVQLDFQRAWEVIAPYAGQLVVAAINAPTSVTLSGDGDALRDLLRSLEDQRVYCRLLALDYAFHSHYMDSIRDDLLASLAGLRPRHACLPFVSVVTGDWAQGPECGPDYWWDNIRKPVQFARAVDRLLDDGCTVFLEIGPHPVLASYLTEASSRHGVASQIFPSLRRQEDDAVTLLTSLGGLYTAGYTVDWQRLYPQGGAFVRLPTYPWQRERHWHQPEANSLVGGKQVHPLVGQRLGSAQPHWQVRMDVHLLSFLHDHKIQGATVFPGTGFLEMSWLAATHTLGGPCQIEEMEILEPLALDAPSAPVVQVLVGPDGALSILSQGPLTSRQGEGGDWRMHFRGRIAHNPLPEGGYGWSPAEVLERCPLEVPREEVYRLSERRGYQYGPAFQGLERIWVGQNEAVGEVCVVDALLTVGEYQIHPAVLDACCQTIIPLLPADSEEGAHSTWVPVGLSRYRLHRRPGAHVLSYVRLVKVGAGWLSADVSIRDVSGDLIAELHGARLQAINQPGGGIMGSCNDWLYEPRWQPQSLPNALPVQRCSPFLVGPRALAEDVQPFVQQWACDLGTDGDYRELGPSIDALCSVFLQTALGKLGWHFRPGEHISAASLVARTGILPRYEGLIGSLLRVLTGVLHKEGEDLLARRSPSALSPEELWRYLVNKYPAFYAELLLLGRMGRLLEQCLTGTASPLEVLSPEQSGTLGALFEAAPTGRLYKRLLREVVGRAVEEVPPTQTLRILEVGAGTGGAAAHILPVLPPDRTKYLYTNRSPTVLARAAETLRSYSFLEYSCLRLEERADVQELAPHSFDLILAADLQFESADVRQALLHLAELLAPRGLVILLEWTRPMRALDLTFGLLSEWPPSSSQGTCSCPPLSPARWAELLESVGLLEATLLADSPAIGPPMKSLILARGPQLEGDDTRDGFASKPARLPSGTWAVLADSTGLGKALGERLRAAGSHVILVGHGEVFCRQRRDEFVVHLSQAEDMDKLVQALQADGVALTGIVHCWSLDAVPPEQTTPASLRLDQELGCLSLIHLIQALVEANWETSPRLWLVTRGAQGRATNPSTMSLAQAPLWGLGRVIRNEHPDLRCTLVDLAPAASWSWDEVRALEGELFADDREEEVLLRDSGRYVARLVRADMPVAAPFQLRKSPGPGSYRLTMSSPGSLGKLRLQAVGRKAPALGEVEIEVLAAGINFKDVLQATGLLSGEALAQGYVGGFSLGLECAGRVVAVGPGAGEWKVGDEVVGFARDAFAGHVITRADFIVRRPAHLSFEEAATIPITFCTACYALRHVGRLKRGERVLIHGAAGGVGLAAIQVASRAGAEVFATAGSPEKREFLRLLGVPHVMDSRSMAFADEVFAITRGEGVDVVLNSLAGEAIRKSLSVLRPFGRFLEIGKRDLVQNTRVGLRPFEKCLSFHAIDLDQLLLHQPAGASSLLREVIGEFEALVFHALPYRVFPLEQAENAFKHLQRSRHIGKVVLSLPPQAPSATDGAVLAPAVWPREGEPICFEADASYLISGGLSGLGLATARWLVDKGARHLVLLGRSGAATLEARATLEAMAVAGAQVMVRQVDVSQEEQVDALLRDARRSLPPLRGVIHSAMVMDDGIVLHLNAERLHRVLDPKVIGAWNLHTHTRDLPLDFFVCFSSFSSLLGLAGQGSYAAANLFLDVLALHRRCCGLPGLTINWGPLGDVGWLARHSAVNERVLRQGVQNLSAQQALEILGRLLAAAPTQVGVINIDWRQWARLSLSSAASPRLFSLIEPGGPEQSLQSPADFSRALHSMAPGDRRDTVLSHLCASLAGVLGTSASKLDVHCPLTALGLDSLMAVELQVSIQRDMGVQVTVMSLLQRYSVADLAGFLDEQLGLNGSGAGTRQVAGL
jgi:acyl transferase domain-containing protein/NADP-dependent 3-hydroxy acid dehydrogenase YdfG